jgi:hypothetical protein
VQFKSSLLVHLVIIKSHNWGKINQGPWLSWSQNETVMKVFNTDDKYIENTDDKSIESTDDKCIESIDDKSIELGHVDFCQHRGSLFCHVIGLLFI